MSEDNEIISGIYNYCDRWCERCPMTHRCQLALDEAVSDAVTAGEGDGETFWEGFMRSFEATRESVKRAFEERGFEIEEVEFEPGELEEIAEQEERRERKARNHPCSKASMAYAERSGNFFRSEQTEAHFAEAGWDLSELRGAGLPAGAGEEAERLWNAVQVLSWYQYQIAVKLQRAADGLGEVIDPEVEALPDYVPDSEGSAKVALIGIDRSLAAWAVLREMLPAVAEEAFELMLELDGVRRLAEAAYPGARAVQRPGFE